MKKRIIKTKDEARQYAIDWQNWVGKQNKIGKKPTLYMSDMVEWGNIFYKIGKKFGLIREFKENGII